MKNKKYWLKRGALGGLCLALAAALLFSPLTGGRQVSAVSSLPYIEKIKSTKSSFNILEIIPNAADSGALAGNGTFGYYAAGSEPCSGWQTRLAAITTPGAREEAAEALFKGLATAGILGSGDGTPLKTTAYTDADGYYQEAYPWMLQSTAGWAALPLAAAESAVVRGTFAPRAANSAGPFFREVFSTEIAAQPNGAYTGDLDQVVDLVTWFSENPALSSDYWFYAPSAWTKLEWKDGTIRMSDYGLTGSSYVYTFVDDTPQNSADQVGHYVSAGQISAILLDKTETYYILDPTKLGAPHPAWSLDSPYGVSRSTAYTDNAAKTGYFQSSSGTAYSLTTDNSGGYVFTASDTGSPFQIYYDQVYFKCTAGADNVYTNNQWFLRKVFDISNPGSGSIAVRVNTYAANNASLATLVRSADLIVLSAGLMPGTGGTPAANIDLTSEAGTALQQAVVMDKTPLVFDWRLANAAFYSSSAIVNLPDLVSGLAGSTAGADHNFATGNLYCFNPSTTLISGQNVKGIATPLFGTAFTATATAAGFSGALSEIESENFLRERAGLDAAALLDAHVSMAAAVRYIINQREARTLKALTSVRVLELQPNSNSSQITSADVLLWLNNPSGLTASNIHITTLSMAEFVGHIEDLVENYDLIYVGDSSTGIKTDSSGQTLYNDTAMNGLLYSNIGDKYRASYRLTGMLDTDYSNSKSGNYYKVASGDTARTFRFSGNDLTSSKAAALKSFAEAGYPVVLGDKLVTYGTKQQTIPFSVTAACSGTADAATLTATLVGDIPNGQSVSYQWYYGSGNTYNAYSGTGARTATCTVSSDSYLNQEFYCRVTIAGGTAAESNHLLVTRGGAGFSIENNYKSAVDDYISNGSTTCFLKIGVSGGNSKVHLSASISPALPASVSVTSWQWEKQSGYGEYSDMSGETNSTLNVEYSRAAYRCHIQLSTGGSCYSGSVSIYKSNGDWYYSYSGDSAFSVPTAYTRFQATASAAVSGNTVTLSAAYTPTTLEDVYYWWCYSTVPNPASTDFSYVSNNYNDGPTYSYSFSASGTRYYYAKVKYGSYTASTNVIKVTYSSGSFSADNQDGGSSGSFAITVPDYGTRTVNTATVDKASQLYDALNTVVGRKNVVSAAAVTTGAADYANNSALLYRYLNLSKPTIRWIESSSHADYTAGYPTKYAMDSAGVVTSLAGVDSGGSKTYYLYYSFAIDNPTDTTPLTTTYDCRLYVDSNSDGLFKTDERLSDVTVRNAATGKALSMSGGAFRLTAGTNYLVTRQLPKDKVGIVPWKLEIVKNGTESYVHASQQNYTHVSGDTKKTIKVLQIMHNNGNGMNLKTDATYVKWTKTIPDFSVNIDTIWANRLDISTFWVNQSGQLPSRADYLAQYDMLILGFNDMYQEISSAAAADILDFAKSHAVLFTHDTTSICNLPTSSYPINNDSTVGGSYWGYAFNTVLRSVVGLDRYGVTDATLGRTNRATSLTSNGHLLSSGSPLTLTPDNIKKVTAAGYTIAYAPKATEVADLGSYQPTALGQTQGYTRHTLVRYNADSAQYEPNCTYSGGNYVNNGGYTINDNSVTTSVSQVNKGQITTYPFDLNSTAFGGTLNSALTVAQTHEQYYQLNMNGDDIVVWYCLAGGNFSTLPNDATNAYYIYTKGNITYSGAGHSGSTVTEQEAKLFINTMVAAFRSVAQQPEVSVIRSADDPTAMPYKYFALDFTGADGTTDTSDFVSAISADKRKVFFRITDPSLSSGSRSTTISYEYVALTAQRAEIANTKKTIAAADAGFSTSYGSGTPYIGQTLWMTVPDEALTLLTDQNTASVRLIIKVHTVNGDRQFDSTASVDLRKIGLFQLN